MLKDKFSLERASKNLFEKYNLIINLYHDHIFKMLSETKNVLVITCLFHLFTFVAQ